MKKAKLASVLLAAALAAAAFAGCSNPQPASPSSTSGASAPAADSSAVPEEKAHKLTVLGVESGAPFKWEEREQYAAWDVLQGWLDDAKLDITWETVSAEQYPVVIQTRLAAGGKLPDIAKVHTLENSEALNLAKQGLIIPLDEAIDQYSNGNIRHMYDEVYKSARPLTTAPDGKLYWFSNLHEVSYEGISPANGTFTILYRKDWADKLGIAEPTTKEEFTDMLVQFREKDANGNGAADEILNIDVRQFRNEIAQWFGLGTGTITVDPQSKKIVTPWKQPGLKDYFTYIQDLVKKGIIDDSIVGNNEMVTQKMAENKVAAVWDYANAPWLEPQVTAVAPDALYAPLMPLPAVDGIEPYGIFEPGNLVWEKYVITSSCEDVEGAIKLFDIVYTEEYSTLSTWGIEGTNFDIVDGVITPKGLSADELAEKKIPEGNCIWPGVLPRVQKIDMHSQLEGRDEYKQKVQIDMLTYSYHYPDGPTNFLAMPTDEETQTINELQTNIDTYAQELCTKLSLGQISVDEIDSCVAKLDELGLSTLVDIAQARYDRYLASLPQ